MNEQGYIKLYRKLMDNPIITKDNDYFRVWIQLLLMANHSPKKVLFGNETIELKNGQLITGRDELSTKCCVQVSKLERILKRLKTEHQIEQRTCSQGRLISILKWNEYQQSEQQNEQQVNNKRTTNEQQMNTNKNDKNVRNINNNKLLLSRKNEIEDIINYLNELCGTHYRCNTQSTLRHINARYNEGFKYEDFINVIINKTDEWLGTDMEKYLTPDTLFGAKFEKYLNQGGRNDKR